MTTADISELIWASRYRGTDSDGVPDRSIEDTWCRVARAIASVERDSAGWERRFDAARLPVPARRPHRGGRRARQGGHAVQLLRRGPARRLPGRHPGVAEGNGVDDAARRWYRAGLLTVAAARVARHQDGRHGVGAGIVHARMGLDVRDAARDRASPRSDDGHAALRPPRHRGIRRRKARAGGPAELQPVGARHGRVPPCCGPRTRLDARLSTERCRSCPDVDSGEATVAAYRGVGTGDGRARCAVRRYDQSREQPPVLRDDQRHQSLR